MARATQLAVYESYEVVFGRRSSLDELVVDIGQFTQKSVLWVCAVIVTGLQLWNKVDAQPQGVYSRLLSIFFDRSLWLRFMAGYFAADPQRLVFHRRQVLLIAKLAILHCSGEGLDARANGQVFGFVLLKANDQFHYNLLSDIASANRPVSTRDDFAKIIMEMVAVGEHSSPHAGHLITRSHLMLSRFCDELHADPGLC